MTRPTSWLALALAAAVTSGCASAKEARARSDYLKGQMEPLVYQKPIEEVWPDVLRLLNDKGYPLVGDDAVAVGQSETWFSNFLSPGSETRIGSADKANASGFLPYLLPSSQGSPKGEGTWRYLKTGLSKSLRMYRVDGFVEATGCRVVFTSYQASQTDYLYFASDTAKRDFAMELELARRADPAAAARIEAGMP
jgi:hypothetical protein